MFSASCEEETGRTLEEVAARLVAPESSAYGAFIDDRLAGIVVLERPLAAKFSHNAFVCGLYVTPAARRRGLGGALLDAIIDHGRSFAGLRNLRLGVNATNAAAIALYRSRGFAPYGLEPEYLCVEGVYCDEAFYSLPLVHERACKRPESGGSPTVRIVRPSEASVLDCVAPGVFDHAVDPRWTAEFFSDPRHHLAVAVIEGQVVGMASALHYVHPDKPPELWVNEVGVTPSNQRQGIGKQLLQALFAHGRALGCKEAWVLTDEASVAARRLYASAGGQETEVVYVTFNLAGT